MVLNTKKPSERRVSVSDEHERSMSFSHILLLGIFRSLLASLHRIGREADWVGLCAVWMQ